MLKFTKRRVTAVLGVVAVLAVAGAAIAYWTAGGTGTATGQAASGTTGLTAHLTTPLTDMYPGDSPQALAGTLDNPNNASVYVTSVAASITGVTPTGAGPCAAADFKIANPTMLVGREVPNGTAADSFSGATIQFNDNPAVNQNGCKGASVEVTYTVS
jgi:hypothetical protein